MPQTTRKARTGHRARTAHNRSSRRKADLGILNTLYDGLSGFQVNTQKVAIPGSYTTTYGEVTPEGIQALAGLFAKYSPLQTMPTGQRTFYDLGCGNGKVVIGMVLLQAGLQGRGYEIVTDRIEQAKTAVGRLKQRWTASRCHFESTSFLEPAVNLGDACWIYISNLCFDLETQKALAEKLEKQASRGCVVICSKEMPFSSDGPFVRVASGEVIPMSWSTASSVNVYRFGGERA